jgi:hypothetical protein
VVAVAAPGGTLLLYWIASGQAATLIMLISYTKKIKKKSTTY